MNSRRSFIVVGAGRGLVLQVLLAIHTFTKAECIVMCAKGAGFLRFSRLVSEYREIDFSGADDDRFVASVNRLVEDLPELVLIPTDCEGARMMMRVRNRLKARMIPAPDSTMLDCLDNKWRFYQFCKECGLNTPPTRFFGDKHELDFASTALELGGSFVVKPLSQAGSKGIVLISSEEDYRRNILDDDAYQYKPLIAQRYIRGTDVGLNLLSFKGKVTAIAIQQRHYPQNEAARISFFQNDYLISVAHTIARESAYEGVMNIDARIEHGSGRVFLFECNPRFWRSVLASAWCGLNFVGETIEPSLKAGNIRMLTAGSADTFDHPLFRPSLWRHALFDRGHRGRMVRAMMSDICLLGSSIVFKAGAMKRARPGVPGQKNAAL